jgi:hypothetical protein
LVSLPLVNFPSHLRLKSAVLCRQTFSVHLSEIFLIGLLIDHLSLIDFFIVMLLLCIQ